MRKLASSMPSHFLLQIPPLSSSPGSLQWRTHCDLKCKPINPSTPKLLWVMMFVTQQNTTRQRPTKVKKKFLSTHKYPVRNKDCIGTSTFSPPQVSQALRQCQCSVFTLSSGYCITYVTCSLYEKRSIPRLTGLCGAQLRLPMQSTELRWKVLH